MPSVEELPEAGTEVAFDRAEAHRWAGAQLARLAPAADTAESVLARYRRQVHSARVGQKAERINARLAALPVQDLARRGYNIKSAPLLDNEVRTAFDVIRLGHSGLLKISNIGERSASQLMSLAQQAARPQTDDLRPPKDSKQWTQADVDLARAMQMFASATELIGMPHLAVLRQLVAALKLFKRATSWLRWLFSGRTRKSAAHAGYAGLRLDSESTGADRAFAHVLGGIAHAQQLARTAASRDEVIDGWNKSIAKMYALLERFVTEGGDPEEAAVITYGLAPAGLSSALRDRISDIKLDLRLVARTLRVYQEFGAKFALVVGRGLLGDDMGLGKTIQALVAIAHAISRERQNHHIVICPAALMDNWLREIRETVPEVIGWAFRNADRESAISGWRATGGILLTSYDQAKHLLSEKLPHIGFVVVDEAHYVKKPSIKRSQVTIELVRQADRALLMGGTLLENRAEELISLAGVIDPRREQRLRDKFGDGRDAHHEPDEFRRELGEFYLRRNRDEVLTELPDVVHTDEPIAVGEPERLAYKDAISQNNPARARIALAAGDGVNSQKMAALRDIIRDCRSEDRKVLIFSEFREVLDTVAKVVGDDCLVIHGDVRDMKRPAILTAFQERPGFAALASQIRVGGVGLNLQAASVVVLIEPQYKPSTEWQARDRAHRMGQSQCVMVYRLVATDSIEERIVELTGFKKELFDKLAKRSELADSLFGELGHRVDERQLLTDERRRLGLDREDRAGEEDNDL